MSAADWIIWECGCVFALALVVVALLLRRAARRDLDHAWYLLEYTRDLRHMHEVVEDAVFTPTEAGSR